MCLHVNTLTLLDRPPYGRNALWMATCHISRLLDSGKILLLPSQYMKDEWMNEGIDGQMNGRIRGGISEQVDGWIIEWMNGRMMVHGWTGRRTDGGRVEDG